MKSGAPKATFYGGANELGGTQILLQIDGQRIWLDFGLNFDRFGKFFTFPQGVKKFNALDVIWKLGVYPKIEHLYRPDYLKQVGITHPGLLNDNVLMSHAHIDHISGVHNLHWDIPVHMDPHSQRIAYSMQVIGNAPNTEFLDAKLTGCDIPRIRDQGRRIMAGEMARISRHIETFHPNEPFKIGSITVHPFYVDHSLPGACAFILKTSVGNIAYTGDLRLRGRHSEYTKEFVEGCKRMGIRYLFTEGSLIFKKHVGDEFILEDTLFDYFKDFPGHKMVAYPPRDMERIETMYNVARKLSHWEGREVPFIIDTRQAYLMDSFAGQGLGYPTLDNPGINIFMPRKIGGHLDTGNPDLEVRDYSAFERKYLDHPNRISLDELRKLESCVFFLAATCLDDLVELDPPKGSVFVRSHPEPYTEEMELGEKVMINWLDTYNLRQHDHRFQIPLFEDENFNMATAHITGHMSYEETEWFLNESGAEYVIPIHTFNARWFEDMYDPDRVIQVQRGMTLELR